MHRFDPVTRTRRILANRLPLSRRPPRAIIKNSMHPRVSRRAAPRRAARSVAVDEPVRDCGSQSVAMNLASRDFGN